MEGRALAFVEIASLELRDRETWDSLEVTQISSAYGVPLFERRRSDKQVAEGYLEPPGCLFRANFADDLARLPGDRMHRHGLLKIVDKIPAPLADWLVLSAMQSVNQFGDRDRRHCNLDFPTLARISSRS